MTSTGRLAVGCLALAAGFTSNQAAAQPFPSVDTGRVQGVSAQDQNVIQFSGGATLERHSNVFRLNSSVDPTASFGKSQRSDTILTGNLGMVVDREASLQRLRLELRLTPTAYQTYSSLNSLGYLVAPKLDWAIGSALYGDIGARLSQAPSSFVGNTLATTSGGTTQFIGSDINLEKRNLLFFTGGLRMTPNWSVFGRVDRETLDNSLNLSYFKSANYTATGTEGGIRFEPGTGTELSLLGRHTKADYPNLQDTSYVGSTPLATPISNNYKQNALLARLVLRPNEDTAIAGVLGYTKRAYDSVPGRDFSGPTARLSFDWRPGPGFYMSTEVFRDLGSSSILTANYVDSIGIRLRPTFVLTGKIRLGGLLSYENIDWKGDPGLVSSSLGVRKDTMMYTGLQLIYDYSRVLSMTADLRREQRTSNSNYSQFDFNNNIFGVGILAKF